MLCLRAKKSDHFFACTFTSFKFHIVCQTVGGANCVNFVYNGASYNGCTNVDGNGRYWCATTTDSNGNYITWNYCVDGANCANTGPPPPPPSTNACQTTNGEPCVNFIYKGVQYQGCTTVDGGGLYWCATSTDSSGSYISWGYCSNGATCSATTTTVGKTTPGAKTTPPATTPGAKTTPPATTPGAKTTLPAKTTPPATTIAAKTTPPKTTTSTTTTTTTTLQSCLTVSGEPCVRFIYNGISYDTCTTVDGAGQAWCATSVDVNKFYISWNYCPTTQCTIPSSPVSPANCNTIAGKRCIFPFKYGGTTYNACTNQDFTTYWCATSVSASLEYINWNTCAADCPRV